MNALVKTQIKSAQIQAVVLNADGSVKKNLGTVSYWHRNPLRRFWWAIKRQCSTLKG